MLGPINIVVSTMFSDDLAIYRHSNVRIVGQCTPLAVFLTIQSEALIRTGKDLSSPTKGHLFVKIILQD